MTVLEQSNRKITPSDGVSPEDQSWIEIQDVDVLWKVHPEFQQDFFSNRQFLFEQWKLSGSLRVIKSGPHRTVYHVTTEAGNVYLKHYKTPDWKSKLQNLVRLSKAMLEWDIEKKMSDFGIPTIETVAIGQKLRAGQVLDSFLITREIPQTETLQELVERWPAGFSEQTTNQFRKELTTQLGEIIGKMHCGLFDHQDLHCGNLLVRINQENRPELWIIDLHAIKQKKQIAIHWIFANLSLFNNYFARIISQTDRRRFFRSWLSTLRSHLSSAEYKKIFGSFTTKELIQKAEQVCEEGLQKRYAKDDRKWNRSHRKQILSESPELSYRALTSLGKEWIDSVVQNPDQLIRNESSCRKICEDQNIQEWIVSLESNGQAKQYRLIKITTSSEDKTNSSGVPLLKSSWINGERIHRRSIDSVQPQLWLERCQKQVTESWLLLEHDEEMIPLGEFLKNSFSALNNDQQELWWNHFSKRMVKNLHWMKECGFLHNSLSGDSLLVHSNPDMDTIQLTEHEALQQPGKITRSQEISQLKRLCVNLKKAIDLNDHLWLIFLGYYLNRENKQTIEKFRDEIDTCTS